jgi:hypothetical protein
VLKLTIKLTILISVPPLENTNSTGFPTVRTSPIGRPAMIVLLGRSTSIRPVVTAPQFITLANPRGSVANSNLSDGQHALAFTIVEAHDPPQQGAQHDRIARQESYVKDFKALNVGTMELGGGAAELRLEATAITGSSAIDFRLLTLELLD